MIIILIFIRNTLKCQLSDTVMWFILLGWFSKAVLSDSGNTRLWYVCMPCWWAFLTKVSKVLCCLFHLYWFYYQYFSPTAFSNVLFLYFVLSHQLLCDAWTEKSLKNKRHILSLSRHAPFLRPCSIYSPFLTLLLTVSLWIFWIILTSWCLTIKQRNQSLQWCGASQEMLWNYKKFIYFITSRG